MKQFYLLILFVLVYSINANSQKIYQLDEIDKLPFVEKKGMKILATEIFALFNKVVSNPVLYSNNLTNDTVYLFVEYKNKLRKYNPMIGNKYSVEYKSDIQQNDKILFNLTFNEKGNLLINKNIYVINYRDIKENGKYKNIGVVAFMLPVTEDLKKKLSNVNLSEFALVDKNSLNGSLTPVNIVIPFSLNYKKDEFSWKGTILKRNDEYGVFLDNGYIFESIENVIINSVKNEDVFIVNKKGSFKYEIKEQIVHYYFDFNIGRGMFTSQQTIDFQLSTYKLDTLKFVSKKLRL